MYMRVCTVYMKREGARERERETEREREHGTVFAGDRDATQAGDLI